MGRVSRNSPLDGKVLGDTVAPRMGRVSRNGLYCVGTFDVEVAPRMGRVSRNLLFFTILVNLIGRAPHGACE